MADVAVQRNNYPCKDIIFTRQFCTSTSHSPGEDIASTLWSGWIRKDRYNLGRKWLSRFSVRLEIFLFSLAYGSRRLLLSTTAPVVSEALHEQTLVLWSRAGAFRKH